jgi:hypothetical protein
MVTADCTALQLIGKSTAIEDKDTYRNKEGIWSTLPFLLVISFLLHISENGNKFLLSTHLALFVNSGKMTLDPKLISRD